MSKFVKLQQDIPLKSIIESNAIKKNYKKNQITEHLMTIDQVAEKHKTSLNLSKPSLSQGLKNTEALERSVIYGKNKLSPPKRKHVAIKFLECLGDLFNVLVIIAAIMEYIMLALDPVYIATILIGVAFLNASIELFQIQKSHSILDSFQNLITNKATIIRQGSVRQVDSIELVPGDVICIRIGDKVAADVRLFSVSDLRVDNSAITGESDPQSCSISSENENPLHAQNIVFNGSMVVSGEGFGIVIRTGDNSFLGQIAKITTSEFKRGTLLSQETARFCKLITVFATLTAVTFFVYSIIVFKNLNNALAFAIGVLVGWVPQGLPATVTMLLAIAAQRILKDQVLVKDLHGVETLGAITLLATDKTGTLTKNQMSVGYLWLNREIMSDQSDSNEQSFDKNANGMDQVLLISSLCTRARFIQTDVAVEKRTVVGDPTEAGLLKFAAKYMNNIDHVSHLYPKVFELPFNSDTKTHVTIHKKRHELGDSTLYIKGAPERILNLCNSILIQGEIQDLKQEYIQECMKAYEYMASQGHRVLALAQKQLDHREFSESFEFKKSPPNYPTNEYCFIGLVSLEDPPKHGVREAIGKCRQAGIKVIMITGDHPLTAEAIAKKINLLLGETKQAMSKRLGIPIDEIPESQVSSITIHGDQIPHLTSKDWDLIFEKEEIIFARTSPQDKLEIVKKAQSLGHIVGVTGDGVNDSPALKRADLGISMNKSASDVSKEAASMILLDDNFASIVKGIIQGRLIFLNLKKTIQYVVSHIMAEVIPYLMYAMIPIPLAITSTQILVVDLGFELLAALSFAWEPPEDLDILLKLRPRKPAMQSVANQELDLYQVDEQDFELPSKWKRYAHEFRLLGDKKHLQDLFVTKGEVLVDSEVLCWSYLEAGLIETFGCLLTFFTVLGSWGIDFQTAISAQMEGGYFAPHSPDLITSTGVVLSGKEQFEAVRQGQSSYFLSILIIQVWNMFICKSKLKLPFGTHMVSNQKTWFSLSAGIFFGAMIVYTPFMNRLFLTSNQLHGVFLLIPFGFGVGLFMYGTLRRWIILKYFPYKRNLEIQGLMMFSSIETLENDV